MTQEQEQTQGLKDHKAAGCSIGLRAIAKTPIRKGEGNPVAGPGNREKVKGGEKGRVKPAAGTRSRYGKKSREGRRFENREKKM